MNVMNAVTMVVDSLNDSSTLVQELKNLGESHGKHNIQESHFRVSWCSCSLIYDCRVYVCITICHDCLSTTEFGGGSRCLPGERSRPATLPRTRQTKLDQSVGRGRQRRCDWIAAAVTRCHRGIDRVKTKTKTKKPVNAGFPFLKIWIFSLSAWLVISGRSLLFFTSSFQYFSFISRQNWPFVFLFFLTYVFILTTELDCAVFL